MLNMIVDLVQTGALLVLLGMVLARKGRHR